MSASFIEDEVTFLRICLLSAGLTIILLLALNIVLLCCLNRKVNTFISRTRTRPFDSGFGSQFLESQTVKNSNTHLGSQDHLVADEEEQSDLMLKNNKSSSENILRKVGNP